MKKVENNGKNNFRSGFRKVFRLPQYLMKKYLLPISVCLFFGLVVVFAQPANKIASQHLPYRIGEKLTYHVSFGKFSNAAYGEIFVASRGKLGDKEAVELQAKFKTTNLVSAFYLLDETRVTYISAESGFPLFTRIISATGVLPKESSKSFLESPTGYFDLVSAVYQIRNGATNINFQENERIFNIATQTGGNEKVKCDAGEFETSIANVQSSYFDENGIREMRVNFSNDENRLPVMIRFKTGKGEFRACLASVQTILPEPVEVIPTPTPTPKPTPMPTPPPKPAPTPNPENEPLSADLPFVLGETLTYRLNIQNQKTGTIVLQAKERRQVRGKDALLLTATMTESGTQSGIFNLGDSVKSLVDPISIAPINVELKFGGAAAGFNQAVQFEQNLGLVINTTNAGQFEVPVGTHGILSLAYAVRQFNLTPSKNPQNPVNDTRVALFFYNRYYVLTLRPAGFETLDFEGRKISAQIISISTGDPTIDQYGIKLWLSDDIRRLPLRLTAGSYRADLQTLTYVLPKPSEKNELRP